MLSYFIWLFKEDCPWKVVIGFGICIFGCIKSLKSPPRENKPPQGNFSLFYFLTLLSSSNFHKIIRKTLKSNDTDYTDTTIFLLISIPQAFFSLFPRKVSQKSSSKSTSSASKEPPPPGFLPPSEDPPPPSPPLEAPQGTPQPPGFKDLVWPPSLSCVCALWKG